MANKKIKSLTLAEIEKQNKKLDKTGDAVLTIDGTDYKFQYDVSFRKSKQFKVLDDLVAFFDKCGSQLDLLEMTTVYTSLLIIKHFTSIEIPDDIDEAINHLEVMVDLDILANVLVALPSEELEKVYSLLGETIQKMTDNLDEAKEEAEKLSSQVENQELKKMLVEDGNV